MPDLTRLRKNAEKKVVSLSSASIKHGDVSATTLNKLFNLPADCLIVGAGVVVDVAGQGGLTVDMGFDGGDELLDGVSVATTGYKVAALDIATLTLNEAAPNTLDAGTVTPSPRILTGTGKEVTVLFSADPTAGEFHFLCEYYEYTRGCGELTALGDGS